MAVLTQFPARPRSRHARRAYQVNKFATDGGMLSSRTITARNDADAMRQAPGLAHQHRVELWSTGRFVAQFGPPAGAIAIAIRMLNDRPLTNP